MSVRRAGAALLAATAALGAGGAPRAWADPRVDWILHCQGCHGPDGRGAPGAVPSLDGVARFLRAEGGRAFLVRVPGVAQSELDDAALAALLDWMLRAFSADEVPSGHRPFDADEVRRHRAVPLAAVEPERRRLLRALEEER